MDGLAICIVVIAAIVSLLAGAVVDAIERRVGHYIQHSGWRAQGSIPCYAFAKKKLQKCLVNDKIYLTLYVYGGGSLAMSKEIRVLMARREVTQAELAERLGTGQSNLANKLKRDNFSESELQAIAKALNATFKGEFILDEESTS